MTLGHIRRRKEGATEYNGHYIYPALFDEVLFSTDGLLDYRIFLEGGRISPRRRGARRGAASTPRG